MTDVSRLAMVAATPLIGQERCESCKYALAVDKGPMVQCRRMPPKLTTFLVPGPKGDMQFAHHTGQPRVGKNEYCGEYKPKLALS